MELSNTLRSGLMRRTLVSSFYSLTKKNLSRTFCKENKVSCSSRWPTASSLIYNNSDRFFSQKFGCQLIGLARLPVCNFQNTHRFIQSFVIRPSNNLFRSCVGTENFQGSCTLSFVRFYSRNNPESDDEPSRTEVKGVVFHVPSPFEWIKNVCYMFVVQGWLDKSFNEREFLFGAKQAISFLTRLTVLKDFQTMKSVASKDVVGRMQEIILPMSSEQQQVLEIIPDNINLAKLNMSSIKYYGEGGFTIFVDVFCVAMKTFKSRPLLIQTLVRFGRSYDDESQGDWIITGIREFNIKELDFGPMKKD